LPYGRFLGYEKGEDGLPKIVEMQAETVRLIYKLFLEGKTFSWISKFLTEKAIPTLGGKQKWLASTVDSILKNEKYKGDAMLQKSYTVDFLTKKKKINEGEIPQYYVEDSHSAIINPEAFDLVQYEIQKRKKVKGYITSGYCFSGKIVCGECGSYYGSKVWHSTSKYRQTVWQCNQKFKNENKCHTPHLLEDTLKLAFMQAFNNMITNKEEILIGCEAVIHILTDTSSLDKRNARLQREFEVINELMRKCVEENAHEACDQTEYQLRYLGFAEQYEKIKEEIGQIGRERLERFAKREKVEAFIRALDHRADLLTEFNKEIWIATVESVTVHSEQDITFTFKDNSELNWEI